MSPGKSIVPSALNYECFKDKVGTLHKVAICLFLYFQILTAIGEDEIEYGDSSPCNTSANPKHHGSLVKVLLQTSLPAPLETIPYEKQKA